MVRNVYFAHPTPMYGTPVERGLEQAFSRRFPGTHLENPNQPQHSEGYAREGMDYFVHLCDAQDAVVFAPFANGTIGAGVQKEVESFLRRGAPVFEYDGHDFKSVDHIDQPVLSVDASRERIKLERAQIAEGHSPYASLADYLA